MNQSGKADPQEPVAEGRPTKKPLELELRLPKSRFLKVSQALQVLCGLVFLCVIIWQGFARGGRGENVDRYLWFALLPFVPALLILMLKDEPVKTTLGRRLTLIVWKISWVISGIVATLMTLAVAYFGLEYLGGLADTVSLSSWVAVIGIVLFVGLVATYRAFEKVSSELKERDRLFAELRSETRDLRASMRDLEHEISGPSARHTDARDES